MATRVANWHNGTHLYIVFSSPFTSTPLAIILFQAASFNWSIDLRSIMWSEKILQIILITWWLSLYNQKLAPNAPRPFLCVGGCGEWVGLYLLVVIGNFLDITMLGELAQQQPKSWQGRSMYVYTVLKSMQHGSTMKFQTQLAITSLEQSRESTVPIAVSQESLSGSGLGNVDL